MYLIERYFKYVDCWSQTQDCQFNTKNILQCCDMLWQNINEFMVDFFIGENLMMTNIGVRLIR